MAGFVNRPAQRRAQRQYSLAIFKPDRIGDFVLALGAIRLLVDHFGSGQCVLIVSSMAQSLAAREFPGTQLVVVPPFDLSLRPASIWSGLKLRHQIGGMRFDKLVCLRHQRLRWQNLLLHWVEAAQPYGLENAAGYHLGAGSEMRFSVQEMYPSAAGHGMCCELEAHRAVIQGLMDKPVATTAVLPKFRSLTANGGPNLLVSPFSSSQLKDLPEGLLLAVLVALDAKYGFPIELSYAPDQMERGRALEAKIAQNGLRVVAARATSVVDYMDRVASACAVLTADTATVHIAVALDLPTVVVLGGGHYGLYGPWRKSARQVWVTAPLPCFHCNWVCTEAEAYCITHIKAGSILHAMDEVLNTRGR
jgi:ADP-heptose:LPS heptosyltransferase